MSGVAIYVEGGGSVRSGQRILRVGFDQLLKPLKDLAAAQRKSLRIVLCGSRDDAYAAFINERQHETETHSLLLVDSEEVVAGTLKQHLAARERHWKLQDIDEHDIHAMVTTMETWIIADPQSLKRFYGQHFSEQSLPSQMDLEQLSKQDVCRDLNIAIGKCPAGQYHKMKHAPKLLATMRLEVVRQRCPHCEAFVTRVEELLRS